MNHFAFVMSLGFGVLALTAQQAFSQGRTTCAPRPVAVKHLAESWGETRRAVMLTSNDRLLEIFADDDSGTWTILRTTPDGVSCVMASGTAFQRLALPAGSPT